MHALQGAERAVALRDLEHPADEIGGRQFAAGIGDEDDELLLDGGRGLLGAGIGLDGEVHLLDHPAEHAGFELVLFENFSGLIDVDFGHGGRWVVGWTFGG
ncbi:MAG TPA: hypothetical protein PLF88_12135 [Opitutaceae bacterium]|nr:hypothetical protein [Opitutaceae bacterium]HRJ47525.1 hypothetical protein [Opitutaceae bacterium]